MTGVQTCALPICFSLIVSRFQGLTVGIPCPSTALIACVAAAMTLLSRPSPVKAHNRARGSHDVDLMSNIISELHELGRSDAWISKHLGMDKDEILRLKQITGLTALFKEVEFGRAWKAIENDLQDEWEEVEK